MEPQAQSSNTTGTKSSDKLPKIKEESPQQYEERTDEQIMPSPVPENEIDTVSVRINDYEGIIQKTIVVDDDYQVLRNDRFVIIGVGGSTITLPNVSNGKTITVKNTGGTDVTIDGGDYNIDGAATYALATLTTKTFLFIKQAGITSGEWTVI